MPEEIPTLGKPFVQSYSGLANTYPVVGIVQDLTVNPTLPAALSAFPDANYAAYSAHVFVGAVPTSVDTRLIWNYELLPGPWLPFTRYDEKLGPIQGRRRAVANTGQVATQSGTATVTYEARDLSSIVSWEMEDRYSDGTGSGGSNPVFPTYTTDEYDPQRGAVQRTQQIVVRTGTEVGTFTNVGGVSTKTDYLPYDGNSAFLIKTIEVWATPGPYLYGTDIDPETNIQVSMTRRLVPNGSTGAVYLPVSTNITAATVATNSVLTVASTNGFFAGMQITVAGNSNTTPSINGTHRIVSVGTGTVTIAFTVTSNASGGTGGTAILSAEVHQEIQPVDSMQSAEITSQVISTSLSAATKTWTTQINHSWPPRVPADGIKLRSETGVSTTTPTGTAEIPTTFTWATSFTYGGDASVQMYTHYGPTIATILREYFVSPPTPTAIDIIKLSTGEIVIQGGAHSESQAISVQTAGTYVVDSESDSNNYRVVSIPPCLIDVSAAIETSFATGQAVFDADIEDSSPTGLTTGASFVLSSTVTEGRLGLFMRETITLTVPSSFT